MRYVGSKNRLAKEILPIILKHRKPGQWYVEPFAGGFNLIQHVANPRLGSDSNHYMVALFQALLGGWDPPTEVSEELYQRIKTSPQDYPPELVGFVAVGCSFGGKWWGGYARWTDPKGRATNFAAQSGRSVLKQTSKLLGARLCSVDYMDLKIPPKSIIYCDPPYVNTIGYKDSFDHRVFWGWVLEQSRSGHQIFVSEFVAPDTMECVWSKTRNASIDVNTSSKQSTEKLFTPRLGAP